MVVFFSISGVQTPPIVSIPKVNGVTSKSKTSVNSPYTMLAWTDAPNATTSSGLTDESGACPKNSATFARTKGILADGSSSKTHLRAHFCDLGHKAGRCNFASSVRFLEKSCNVWWPTMGADLVAKSQRDCGLCAMRRQPQKLGFQKNEVYETKNQCWFLDLQGPFGEPVVGEGEKVRRGQPAGANACDHNQNAEPELIYVPLSTNCVVARNLKQNLTSHPRIVFGGRKSHTFIGTHAP